MNEHFNHIRILIKKINIIIKSINTLRPGMHLKRIRTSTQIINCFDEDPTSIRRYHRYLLVLKNDYIQLKRAIID